MLSMSQSENKGRAEPIADCLDDVVLPPGGRPRIPAARVAQTEPSLGPEPCYMDERGRDLRIDLLRGYFVVAMIVDHVRGASPLYLLTGGNRFYTSAAEGFILTSGLVSGLVYRRLIERDGVAPTLMKVITRAGVLYLLTVALTLLFLPISELLYLPWAQALDVSNPLAVVVSILTLHRTYYLVDVMLLYTVLFVAAALTFIFLERGKTWPVLAGSWLLWGLFQVFPESVALPWPIAGNYLFDFSAWQVLFFSGLVLGYRQDRLPVIDRRSARVALIATSAGVLLLIGAYFIVDPPTALMPPELATGSPVVSPVRLWFQDNFFAKVALRPGRLLASAIVFSFLFIAVTVFWHRVQAAFAWLLAPLGQHALYAYTAHIVLVTLVAIVVAPFQVGSPGPQWLNALIQIASVMLIWLLVRVQFLSPTPATRRYWYASPIVFTALAMLVLWLDPSPRQPGVAAQAPRPVSAAPRVPSRFGTPIPRAALQPGAAAIGTPMPVPTPTPTPAVPWKVIASADALTRIGPYLSEMAGSLQERWFYSPELDRDMPYWIYQPPDYGLAGRHYPVLYMLHGLGGHRDEWIVYGLMDAADRAIRAGNIPPMLIVLPQGDKDYWVNHVGDGPLWGEYVARDLVTHIDTTYRAIRSARARAIGGLSMGAWGALHHAFSRTDVFGVVGAHSVSLRPDDGSLAFLGRSEEFATRDPLSLARSQPGLDRLRIWIDMPELDPWLEEAKELHLVLAGRGVSHNWQVFPGEHAGVYWMEHILDYLRYYGNALARQ
jgi:enterochelin esterase-like enzyme